jgi:hypothetical protein
MKKDLNAISKIWTWVKIFVDSKDISHSKIKSGQTVGLKFYFYYITAES